MNPRTATITRTPQDDVEVAFYRCGVLWNRETHHREDIRSDMDVMDWAREYATRNGFDVLLEIDQDEATR